MSADLKSGLTQKMYEKCLLVTRKVAAGEASDRLITTTGRPRCKIMADYDDAAAADDEEADGDDDAAIESIDGEMVSL